MSKSQASPVAAGAYAWFRTAVQRIDPELWGSWWHWLDRNFGDDTTILWTEPWPHDYWVAHGVRHAMEQVPLPLAYQTWSHRGLLDDWPRFEAADRGLIPPGAGRVSHSAALDNILARTEPLDYHRERSLAQLASLSEALRRTDSREPSQSLRKSRFIRAWLNSVVGTTLSGVFRAPSADPDLLYHVTLQRVDEAMRVFERERHLRMDLAEAIETFYCATWPEGLPIKVPTQQGQSREWRDHWLWLAQDWEREPLLEAVDIVAKLLVCPPIMDAIGYLVSRDRPVSALGLCVLRRYALGLRALAWLEAAVSHPWQEVQLSDLATFAFAAIAPWWPRASLALSHRSSDAKPELMKLDLWGAPQVAIDAMTVPIGESNTGMVWRLFAAAPMIARVRSVTYTASPWCRREFELTQYLLDHSDFSRSRIIADVTITQLPTVDRAMSARGLVPHRSGQHRPLFPPSTLVLDVPSYPALIIDIFAAVCTLRLLRIRYGDVGMVNQIADELIAGRPVDLPPPTNHPQGWDIHYAVFAELGKYSRRQKSPVRLARRYPDAEGALDMTDIAYQLPDLTSTQVGAVDVLAALEWNREIRRWFSQRWNSHRTVIDCRRFDVTGWSRDPRHALKRGMLQLRSEAITFVVQTAGQAVESWPGMQHNDPPILTVYLPDQHSWINFSFALPTWVKVYTSLRTLRFDRPLVDAMRSALIDQFTPLSRLPKPREPGDVFAVESGPGTSSSTGTRRGP
jgi:hypothetical protein